MTGIEEFKKDLKEKQAIADKNELTEYGTGYLTAIKRYEKLILSSVVVAKRTLCYCGGNERVALDCTMKPCKHPKYFKQ